MSRPLVLKAKQLSIVGALGCALILAPSMVFAQEGGAEAPAAEPEPAPVASQPARRPASRAGGGLAGKLRLGLDTDVLQLVALEGGSSYTILGVGYASLPVFVGYMLTDSIFLGGRFGLSHTIVNNANATAWSVMALFEYLFLSGIVRPFVSADVAVGGGSANLFGFGTTGVDFGFDGGGGLHLFLTESFSIDPRVTLGMRFGDTAAWQFMAKLHVGLSGYF